ncbi:killer cell immunoglobulin-like receptor 3DL1 [Erpetoichthys calabaricus]|uniref:killer cell immunoglobulin-like receptor 3DL1 n=1 Tax=Erpetoichthys calabaricus TaxID=27687 RepID=UPI00223472BC|nr:killer cell immunoglobulin-like receptor 3DL1 [Erpetoichthys calabaricus]
MGDTVTLKCNTEGGFTGWNYYWWYKEDQTNMGNQINSVNGQTYTFQLVAQTDKGSYRCKAYSYSSPRYSQTSHPVTLTTHERTAKLALNSKQIFEGDQVILYCQVDGNPAGWEYELCWNGCEKPYKSNVKSTFTISPVNVSHSGVYKCRAGKGGIYSKYSNDVQLQVSGIWVTLSASPSSSVKIGDSLNLICTWSENKTSHSKVTFIFLRNNKTIKSSSDSTVLTINQFNESHTGSYKCGVESAGGGITYSNETEIKVQEFSLTVILVGGGLGLFLLILLPLFIVYHRTRGLPCSGSNSARTHKKVADANTHVGGAVEMDTLNKREVLYSELVNLPKGKKKGDSAAKADSGVVYSDLIIGKLKKKKPGKEPTGTQEVLYSDIKLKNVTGDSAAESGDPVYSNIVIEKSEEKKKKKKDAPPADDQSALYASVLPKKGKK